MTIVDIICCPLTYRFQSITAGIYGHGHGEISLWYENDKKENVKKCKCEASGIDSFLVRDGDGLFDVILCYFWYFCLKHHIDHKSDNFAFVLSIKMLEITS